MKRIGILTAGGDTPALNATIYGAVARANALRIEVVGFIKGFNSLYNRRVPHVFLNPLFQAIPELDPTIGGTLLGASRDFVDANDTAKVRLVAERLHRLQIDGLVCVGGDGTMNAMQPLAEHLPTVLAPKTIDNDMGLNYHGEPDDWRREDNGRGGHTYRRTTPPAAFALDQMVNFVTPGYATSVFVTAAGIQRIRTTAESHRRIAIVEVMGRHSGFIALGSAYGQPDIVLVPESPVNLDRVVARIQHLYDLQKNVVIVCGEGIIDEHGEEICGEKGSSDPAGNAHLGGAAEVLRSLLAERLSDRYFRDLRRGSGAREAIFTRKVGHTQRGGRPLMFDRFHAAQLGGKAVDLLATGQSNCVATLQWTQQKGLFVDSFPGNGFRDRWGHINARRLHPAFYDAEAMKPSRTGIDYLTTIFTRAIGRDDVDSVRETLFAPGNLLTRYHSINTDMNKRLRYVDESMVVTAETLDANASNPTSRLSEDEAVRPLGV
jgi:6-phosphofructokinase 1